MGGVEAALDALLHRLVEGAFVLTDGHGAVSKWSEPAELLFGRPAPDVLGRSFFDTLIAAPLAPAGEGWRRFLAAGDAPGAAARVDLHAQHANGHPFVVELVFVPVRLEEGFDFSLFLDDLGFELEPAERLARLRGRHPVVIGALRAALAEEPQAWDPAWRVAGTLVAFRPLGETPWAAAAEAEDLRALVGELCRSVDALTARLDDFQAGFEEARQAAEAARREVAAARSPDPRDAGDIIRILPSRQPAAAPPERPRRAGFDDAAAPMALLTLDGHFREINPAFSLLVGYPEHAFTKAVWPSAHDRGDYREQCDQLRRMRAGELESVRIRSTYMHGLGLMVPVRGELALVRDAEGRPEHLLLRAEERSSH